MKISSHPRSVRFALTLLLMTLCMNTALAQKTDDKEPTVNTWEAQVLPGDTTIAYGEGFESEEAVTFFAHGQQLNDEPFPVDQKGGFKGKFEVPADAEVGILTVNVKVDGAKVGEFEVGISREVPLSGTDKFTASKNQLSTGLYQVAYSDNTDALFITRATFEPSPQTALLKVDAQTLELIDSTTPPASPARNGKGKHDYTPSVFAAFGIGVDSVHQTVWVTNTLNGTVAVYRQQDLSLLKQFKPGLVPHSHSVVVDTEHGTAYVSSWKARNVAVFNTKTLQHVKNIDIDPVEEGASFVPVTFALNSKTNTLYVSSMNAPAIAVIDTASNTVKKVFRIEQARSLRGLAWDADNQLLLAAGYGSDSLLIIDPTTGKLVHDIYVGAAPLAVTWEPESGLAFVSTRGGDSIAVVEPATGELVANLNGGSLPNHVITDGKGHVFAVNKSHSPDDPNGDYIRRITPKAN